MEEILYEHGDACFIVDDYLVGGRDGGRRRVVSVRDVLAEHAVGVEVGAVNGDAVAADAGPAGLIGEGRSDRVLELGVDALGFDALVFAVLDGPSR